MSHFNPVAEIMKSVGGHVIDRRTYRSPKDRAIDAIRCLRMTGGAEDLREIVSALQAHAGHVLAGQPPEKIAAVTGHLNDCAIALLDME